jgi:hypothetical protein
MTGGMRDSPAVDKSLLRQCFQSFSTVRGQIYARNWGKLRAKVWAGFPSHCLSAGLTWRSSSMPMSVPVNPQFPHHCLRSTVRFVSKFSNCMKIYLQKHFQRYQQVRNILQVKSKLHEDFPGDSRISATKASCSHCSSLKHSRRYYRDFYLGIRIPCSLPSWLSNS